MKKEIKELKSLGADVIELKNGLKLIGDWSEKYNKYHNLFVEITGDLYTNNTIQHKDFLKNLTSLGSLDTYNTVQHKDFLKNLTSLRGLNTNTSTQHKDFLKNLTSLGNLYTSNVTQHKDFLRNLASLGCLYTSRTTQHKDFLKNLISIGCLDTCKAIQHKDFLKNLTSLGSLDTSYEIQHKDFLKNLTSLGYLYTCKAIQHKDFLKNLISLGRLNTFNAAQHPEFLKNTKSTFDLPFIYADGILSIVKSTKEINGVIIHNTNRVGYSDIEYIAEQDGVFAHAKTIELALIDLRFKQSNRDTSWLKDKKLSDELNFSDAVLAYRCVTGACTGGVEGFLNKHNKKEKYNISEIIELTKNEYGNESFAEFFK